MPAGNGPALAPYVARIDPSRYDRAPDLAPDELRAARGWVAEGMPIRRWHLPRLYDPLAEALLADGGDRLNRLHAIRRVLLEVGRSGQAYWAWDEQRWIELIERREGCRLFAATPQLMAAAYVLCGFRRFFDLKCNIKLFATARLVFGADAFDRECDRLVAGLERVGYRCATLRSFLPSVVAAVALERGDPRLESFDNAVLERTRALYASRIGKRVVMLANGLSALGITKEMIRFRVYADQRGVEVGDVHPGWIDWCRRWVGTSTLREATRHATYNVLMRVGIWLRRSHPEVAGPEGWTPDVCAGYLAAVDRLVVGEWTGSAFDYRYVPNVGKPVRPQTKVAMHHAMRRFLTDAERWGWAKLRCNPRYHLATPRAVLQLVKVDPRTIDDPVWLKLIWASLNLEAKDLPQAGWYPLELVKAVAVVWTHAGLRRNEIQRLRLNCTRRLEQGNEHAKTLCWLDVPVGKNSAAYTKPVSIVVHEHAEAWRRVRPAGQRKILDHRAGERVDHLFQIRGRILDRAFVNATLIPILCAKAGVPLRDSRGRITSHRARASAVTMLANAPNGMSAFELAKWCGQLRPDSIMSYLRATPTRLAASFAKADQSTRMIEVIIDQEAIASGAAAREGVPWKYYDLGHSWCSNAFWSSCPHRMACAGCSFNVPKESAKGVVLAAQRSATRLLEEVWLSPDERAAVEGDMAALDGMLAKLRDVPTLDGRTPRQIGDRAY